MWEGRAAGEALVRLEVMWQKGPEPNVIKYRAAISACENAKQSEEALAVRTFVVLGLSPTAVFALGPTLRSSV